MKRSEWLTYLQETSPLVLDGATGTNLQAAGMPSASCRNRRPLVAGDLAPTGEFLAPAGNLTFDQLVEIYREQVRGLLVAGVDLFIAETMLDLAQAGVQLIGGCCGTRPDHIAALATELRRLGLWSEDLPRRRHAKDRSEQAQAKFSHTLCSARQTIDWRTTTDWPTIRISDPDDLLDEVLIAAEDEPGLICIDTRNFRQEMLVEWLDAIDTVQMTNPIPLVFSGEDPVILQAIVDRYQGRTGIPSKKDQPIHGSIMREQV
jgi:hypothetical protein